MLVKYCSETVKMLNLSGDSNTLFSKVKRDHFFLNPIALSSISEGNIATLTKNCEDIEKIRMERDYYKHQASDLQVICSSYAEAAQRYPLVKTGTTLSKEGGELPKLVNRIQILENQRDVVFTEIHNLAEIIEDQEKKIRHLIILVNVIGRWMGGRLENCEF